ncbi:MULTISPECIES: penicillin-binding protein 2 [unclassified Salinivibrio]|uniref:penicillin-binding protein 2 n=1 Tax=unclassified Salinivibrio TaxID=2636825 RepID=UPI0009861D95|nr:MULTISPECIES: penicillin-binding protein 2 [unclassified Salinivibrio]OOF10952.1 penicillin-binding protein 2 [Salinivibrio sp. PR5]OOF15258.1 penicillin-binding protein 2 [Salinivibrio sp. PR919]OOF18273.1 penicillin-binding protein 2 [Salinivibrio sp. PR932]
MKRQRSQIRDHSAEAALFVRRAIVCFIGIIALVGILLTNLYHIQVVEHQDYQTRSNDNRIKVVPVAPNRGLIYDRNGKLLAENRPVYHLEITPEQVDDMPATLARLQSLLSLSDSDIDNFQKERRRSRRFNAVPLKTQLTDKEVAIFSAHQHQFSGVEIKAYLKRHYPYGDALTHVLGYVAKINDRDIAKLRQKDVLNNYRATRDIGKLGIEKYYEPVLHGKAGYQEVEVNSRGRIIRTLKYVPPVPGKDLILNLDIDLQLYIRGILGDRRGAVVVLDPKTSGVLAMVSTPSYDPNLFVHGISSTQYSALLNDRDRPLVNRATLGIYPPASTVKPFIAVAALEEGIITTKTTRNDPGYWRIPNSNTRPFRDWLPWGHGRVNIVQSIEESVDTFFYQIAYDMGIDKLSSWMEKFGFGQYTGIDIQEESSANMPNREWKMSRHRQPWYKGDTIPVGIGQGYWTATPMQIAKALTVVLNRGEVKAPKLLMLSRDEDGMHKPKPEPYPPIQGVSDKYWDVALEGMRLVNHGRKGTARRSFRTAKYVSGGKSGTAQVFGLGEDEEYNADEIAEHLRDHALYIGFAPFEHPKVAVSMVLENAGGGSSNGAPIARRIFDHILIEKDAEENKEAKQ